MLDIRRIREDTAAVRSALARRGDDGSALERVVAVDEQLRARARERDEKRAAVNATSKQVGEAMRAGDQARADELRATSRKLGEEEAEQAQLARELEEQLRDLLLRIPNLPAEDCPDGAGEEDNVVVRVEGHDPAAYGEHQRVPHWDIGTELGILDLERGVKLSGSMFVVYRGAGAALVRALCQLCLDRNADLYEEVRPPTLVLTETMVSTGHLPKFAEDAYHVERDDLWAVPTAEVPLTSLSRDEILSADELPRRFMAHTSCFRREAGSAGKDTRGLLRVHEFDKVELLAYATPEQAPALHAEILERAESIVADLGLAYRILDLCAGDIGNSSARTFDIEVYSPGCDRWLECSSVSWFSDYQARRANIRYRLPGEKSLAVVHTLNGSGLAVPRVWAALVETHRRADGTIDIPEPLRPYMRGLERIGG